MDKARIASALTLLVGMKSFTTAVKQIRDVTDNWETRPMLFAGKLEPLNALVDVGLQKREALDKLFELALTKRRQLPEAKRIDYQRNLMSERRDRVNKAVQLEELMRGTRMIAADREAYKRLVQSKWMAERNKYIASKGALSWKQRNDTATEFWRNLDAQLNKDLAEAKQVLERPPMKRKRVVQVAPPPITAMSRALDKAKAKRKAH